MKQPLLIIFLILFGITGLLADNCLEIIKITENNVQLHLRLENVNFVEHNEEGVLYQSIEIPNIDYNSICEEGKPQLPFFSKVVGLPVDGDFSVSVISESYRIIENRYIVCNPTYSYENDELIEEYIEQSAIYKNSSYFPNKIFEAERSGYVGDRYLGSVRIFPIQFNPTQKRVKLYTDLIINVEILGDTKGSYPRGVSNFLDNVADDLIINNQFSQNWRKERETTTLPKEREDEGVIARFRLHIDKKGIYQIPYSFLKDSVNFWQDSFGAEYQFDFDIDALDPRMLELSNSGTPTPIYFFGEEDGSFDNGDYFEFYADIIHGKDCFYDNYSWENRYYLEYKEDSPGARMAVEDCGLYESSVYKPRYFDTSIHFEKQNTYKTFSSVEQVREDRWIWVDIIAPEMKIIAIDIPNPTPSETRKATIDVSLIGESTLDHHAVVYINASFVGEAGDDDDDPWDEQNEVIISGSPANEHLYDGENLLYISMPGDVAETDKVLLNYIDVTYWREYVAYEDMLEFNKPSFKNPGLFQFEIEGFQVPDIDIYKIGVSKLEKFSIESTLPEEGTAPYIISFQDQVFDDSTKYIALSQEQKLLPKGITPDIPSNLISDANQADYIVISKRDFLEHEKMDEFVAHWKEYKDLNVKPVALQDIFDEFGGGIRSAKAIKDFLQYAYTNWQEPVVKYVLLFGDGGFDERDSSPDKKYSIVPTTMGWIPESGATASDNWFVCIVGDDELPDLAIGRIPIWKKEQVPDVLEKTIHYNSDSNFDDLWRNHCVLIAGETTFSNGNEELKKKYISNSYRVSRVYPSLSFSDPYWGRTSDLKEYIDDGTALIQFIGHGSGESWSSIGILNVNDIEGLFNKNYPIIISLACYTADFAPPRCTSLAEKFVIESGKAAIGFFGGAGISYAGAVEGYSEKILENVFTRKMRTFSEIISLAKIEYSLDYSWNRDSKIFTRSSNYLGDPAIDIVLPKNDIDIELESHEFVLGDTVLMTINVPDTTTILDDLEEVAYYVTDEQDLIPHLPHPSMKQVEYSDIEKEDYAPSGYDYVIDTTQTEAEFTKIVRFYAYDDANDYISSTIFTVGKSAIFEIITIPEIPALGDSVKISAKAYDKDGINSVTCTWWHDSSNEKTIQMTSTENDSSTFITESSIDAFDTDELVHFQIEVIDDSTNIIRSEEMEYQVKGADLEMQKFDFTIRNSLPGVELQIKNIGEIASDSFDVYLKKDNITIDSFLINELQHQELLDTFVVCWLETGIVQVTASANPDTSFLEMKYDNNTLSETVSLNYFEISPDTSSLHNSMDSNFVVTFSAGIVDTNSYFYINNVEVENAEIQSDIFQIPLKNNDVSSYEIGLFDSTQLDVNGKFRENIELTFFYSDTLAPQNFKIYRYEPEFRHWFLLGGDVNADENSVTFAFVDKPGIFSLFQNNDFTSPSIDVSVEGQEFTSGEYVDNDAIFSFIFQDDNGINPEKIKLFLNGDSISTYSISTQNLNSVPVKHQIDVEAGSYTFIVSAVDVNGNYQEFIVNFEVLKEFNLIRLGNYPNPVISSTIDPDNAGNTRFTYTLTDDADAVTIKIYTVSGRLVNTLTGLRTTVGYHEYPRAAKGWNCTDFDGRKLANGVYFWKIIATKGKKTLEKINKMAILK